MKKLFVLGAIVLCVLMASCDTQTPSETTPPVCVQHAYGEWTTTTVPNCTEDGVDTRICVACGEVQTRIVSSHGHTMTPWVTVRSASCLEIGEEMRQCERCTHREQRTLAAHGHSYNDWVTVAGSCDEGTERTRLCVYCGNKEREYFAPMGHLFGEWILDLYPGCTENGRNFRVCAKCGAQEYQYLAPTGHELSGIRCDKCASYIVAPAGHELCMMTPEFGVRLDYTYLTRENDEDIYHIVYTASGSALDIKSHSSAPQGSFVLYTESHDSYWYVNKIFLCMTGTQLTEEITIRVPAGTKITALEFKLNAYIEPSLGPVEGDLFWYIYQ